MAFRRFKSTRSRLTAILLAVFLPIGALMGLAAWSNYRFTLGAIERDYGLVTSFLAGRMRIWLRNNERALAAAAASIGAIAADQKECDEGARRVIDYSPGYAAITIRLGNGMTCGYSRAPALNAQGLGEMFERASRSDVIYRAVGAEISSSTRLYYEATSAARLIAVYAASPSASAASWSAMWVMEPDTLTTTMSFGENYPLVTVATVLADGQTMSQFGPAAGAEWRSRQPVGASADGPEWGMDGVRRVYATRAAIPGTVFVVAAFPDAELARANRQLMLLLALPALMLGSLAIVFIRATDIYVLRWIGRLEQAARQRSLLNAARIEVSPDMPDELRNFAGAFNDMAQAEETRRAALEKALDENRFLIRELHHRVKNSLQVIQSYIAIEARGREGEARAVLVDAELRIKIMAIAYRIAMAEGTIRSVDLVEFLGQVTQAVQPALARGQLLQLHPVEASVPLGLEKVIALGFLIAEIILRAGQAAPRFILTLRVNSDETHNCVAIASDRPLVLGPAPRISRGLMLQLGASSWTSGEDNVVAGWRWPRTELNTIPPMFN